MTQITTGLYSLLNNPWVYDFFQNIAGAKRFRKIYINEYINPKGNERILDIGCGTAVILEFLPNLVDYIGCDASAEYIETAKARYGSRGNFICMFVDEIAIEEMGEFDIVMANGLFHHLNDDEVVNLGHAIYKALRQGGRLITHDPCYNDKQSALAKYIISKDRGQNIRNDTDYPALLRPFLGILT
jgi:SAM-dependent methyltransferase